MPDDRPKAAMTTRSSRDATSLGSKQTLTYSSSSSSQSHHGRRLPDVISHRGHRAKYPENTIAAFKAAVKAGANAIETDIHLTKDGVVVLSHDADLVRCFDRPAKLIDCDWSYLKTLETVREPKQHLATLTQLLEYLAEPHARDIWLLLDIKRDNDAEAVIQLMAKAIAHVPAAQDRPWHSRIHLGCWTTNYIPLVERYLGGFPVSHIGFSTSYARKFFDAPNVSFNILLPILQGPGGRSFIHEMQDPRHHPVWAWTVNKRSQMEWCIRRNLAGIITDDPELLVKVCREFDGTRPEPRLSFGDLFLILKTWILVIVLGSYFRNRHGGSKGEGRKPVAALAVEPGPT